LSFVAHILLYIGIMSSTGGDAEQQYVDAVDQQDVELVESGDQVVDQQEVELVEEGDQEVDQQDVEFVESDGHVEHAMEPEVEYDVDAGEVSAAPNGEHNKSKRGVRFESEATEEPSKKPDLVIDMSEVDGDFPNYGITPKEYNDAASPQGTPATVGVAFSPATPSSARPPAVPETPREAQKKLRFKKSAVDLLSLVSQGGSKSRFRKWSRTEMIDILICNDIELRAESQIPTVSLRDLCDTLFDGQEMPEKRAPLTIRELVLLNKYAQKIQEMYTERLFQRRLREELETFEFQEDAEELLAEEVEVLEGPQGQEGADLVGLEEGIVVRKKLSKRTLGVLESKWIAPSAEKALETLKYLHPRRGGKGKDSDPFHMSDTSTGRHCIVGGCGEQCDLWGEGMISSFSVFGPGVTNYFKFLKWLYWVFFILSVISLPELVTNIYGATATTTGLSALARTTVGNLANNFVNNTGTVHLPGCQSSVFGSENCEMGRDKLGIFYCCLDLTISTFILVAYAWLWMFERREETKLESMTWYTSMYAVAVRHLPADTTEEELKHHFNKLLVFSEDEYVTVNDVVIAKDSCTHIEKLRERGALLHKKARLVHYLRYQRTTVEEAYQNTDPEYVKTESARLVEEFTKACADVDEKILEVDKMLIEIEGKKDIPVVAFVTFEHIVGAQMIKALYQVRLVDRILKCLFPKSIDANKEDLLFKGEMLDVRVAPEPSTILWENLESSVWERRGRRILTFAGAVLLVILSVIVTFGSKLLQQRASATGGTTACPNDFTSMTQTEQEVFVSEVGNEEYLHCYCDQYSSSQQYQLDLCKYYAAEQTAAQVLTFFSSFIVLAVSSLIEMAIRHFAHFEKHLSQDSKEKSIFMRLFFLKYLNTSIVFLINNNQVLMELIFGTTAGASTTSNFSALWYTSIGVSILIVQMGNCLSAQSTTLSQFAKYMRSIANANNTNSSCWRYFCCIFCCALPSKNTLVTQSELNHAYHGPEFELAFRYASILSTFSVILTFNAGIPLLNMVAFAFFGIYYYVDKYCFIKLYRTPHRYNADMGKLATSFIPFIVLLHLGMAMWMLANPEIFDSTADLTQEGASFVTGKVSQAGGSLASTFANNISYDQTYPLFCYFLTLLACIISYYLFKHGTELYKRFRILVKGEDDEQFQKYLIMFRAKASPSFSRAVRRNIINGLPTYNLLHNPVYKEAFGVSWQFALRNNTTLRDVRKSMFVSGDEDDVIKAHYTAKLKYKLGEMDAGAKGKKAANMGRKRVVSTALKGLDFSKGGQRASLAREKSDFGRAALIAEALQKEDEEETLKLKAHIVLDEEIHAFDDSAVEGTVLDEQALAEYDAMVRKVSGGSPDQHAEIEV
jgi:hypothetical protein